MIAEEIILVSPINLVLISHKPDLVNKSHDHTQALIIRRSFTLIAATYTYDFHGCTEQQKNAMLSMRKKVCTEKLNFWNKTECLLESKRKRCHG